MYSRNIFHVTLRPYQDDNSELYKFTRTEHKSITRLKITLEKAVDPSQSGDQIIMWNLLPYWFRILPQRFIHHARANLFGRTRKRIGDEIQHCKYLNLLDITRVQPTGSNLSSRGYFKDFMGGLDTTYSQLFQNPQGRFTWSLHNSETTTLSKTCFRSTDWLSSLIAGVSPKRVKCGYLLPCMLYAALFKGLLSLESAGSLQVPLVEGNGFIRLKGNSQRNAATGWISIEIEVWIDR